MGVVFALIGQDWIRPEICRPFFLALVPKESGRDKTGCQSGDVAGCINLRLDECHDDPDDRQCVNGIHFIGREQAFFERSQIDIEAENSKNSSACAYMAVRQRMKQVRGGTCQNAGRQEKEDEPGAANQLFQAWTEDRQGEAVQQQVGKGTVKKDRSGEAPPLAVLNIQIDPCSVDINKLAERTGKKRQHKDEDKE